MFAKPFFRNIKGPFCFQVLGRDWKNREWPFPSGDKPQQSSTSSVGFSLLVGPLTKSGSAKTFLEVPRSHYEGGESRLGPMAQKDFVAETGKVSLGCNPQYQGHF